MKKVFFVVVFVLLVVSAFLTSEIKRDIKVKRQAAVTQNYPDVSEVNQQICEVTVANITRYIAEVKGRIEFAESVKEVEEIEKETNNVSTILRDCRELSGEEKMRCIKKLEESVPRLVSRWNNFLNNYSQKKKNKRNEAGVRFPHLPFFIPRFC